MSLTTDPTDPALGHGADTQPGPQNAKYLVLSAEERAKGFVKPFRDSYTHKNCGSRTRMGFAIAETYARDPWFYGATYCVCCRMHRPLAEFLWEPDSEPMDPGQWPPEEHERIAALRKQEQA